MKFLNAAYIAMALCLSFSLGSQAQEDAIEMAKPYQVFGEYTVHFSLFNSKLLSPKIAKATGFVRADDRALVNIAVVKGKALSGSPAKVSGSYKNLIQQQRELEFKEIKETNATYYIAPLRYTDQDILHFTVEVTPEGSNKSFTVSFSRKMYKD